MARSGECILLCTQLQKLHSITWMQITLLSNCRFIKQIGDIVVIFEDVHHSSEKHMTEDVIRVHVVKLSGFLWKPDDGNVSNN